MALTIVSFASILLCALLFGVFWGPWLALSRSMATFEAPVFLAVVARMDANLGTIMGYLMPLALASIVPVIVLATGGAAATLWLAAASLGCFVVTAFVTMAIEVPIVTRIRTWSSEPEGLPADWQNQRDRWVSFHHVRVVGGFVGLALLIASALF